MLRASGAYKLSKKYEGMLHHRRSQKVPHSQTVLWSASAKSFPGKTGRRTTRPQILPLNRAGLVPGGFCRAARRTCFFGGVPAAPAARLANSSWMDVSCKRRKDVGQNHLSSSFPRLPVWWCIFLSSYVRSGHWVFRPERVHSLNQRFNADTALLFRGGSW